jgi:branched-chain amino acid aminotransferase
VTEANYADRDGWIWLDGALVPWRDAKLHTLSHGLHYSSSVFEGQRAYDGEIFKLTEHSERLRASAERLGYSIPWDVAAIDEACRSVLAANGLGNAYLRPIAWRGSEEMGVSAPNAQIHLAIAAWHWGAYFGEEDARRGVRLEIARWRRPPPDSAPTDAKASGLYMIATMAKQEAEARGYGDALMLDWRGQVAEATGANVFFVKDGALHTPTPDCFLDGITRQTIIELACARGIAVFERAIRPEELEGFEEMFLTGSAAEVAPVAEAGPWRFEVGAVGRLLLADYLALVKGRRSIPESRAA